MDLLYDYFILWTYDFEPCVLWFGSSDVSIAERISVEETIERMKG